MEGNSSSGFDAGAYWQQRVGVDADVATVGHRAMGAVYNAQIYARRVEALEVMLLRHLKKPLEQARVLDIGCGSGFYTGFWQARGVRNYVGLDISADAIARLSGAYPEYRFVQADIAAQLPGNLVDGAAFDIITVFDVLYHIVDDELAQAAIANTAAMLDTDGRLFIMDFLCRRNYRVSKHVIYRARNKYIADFCEKKLTLADSELLFHFLVPPYTGIRIIDFLSSGAFALFGRILRLNEQFSLWVASRLRRLDQSMRERGVSLRNGELLVFVATTAAGN